MKKIILLILVINFSFLFAQEDSSNKSILKEKRLENIDTLKYNEEKNHQTFSLGGGLFYVNDNGSKTLPVISFSTTFQLSKKFLIELEYSNCPGKYHEADRIDNNIFCIFFQTSYNLSKNKLKLYPGAGFGNISINGGILLSPMGNAKVEYNLNRWFSIDTELVIMTYWLSSNYDAYPLLLKLNSNLKLPY